MADYPMSKSKVTVFDHNHTSILELIIMLKGVTVGFKKAQRALNFSQMNRKVIKNFKIIKSECSDFNRTMGEIS